MFVRVFAQCEGTYIFIVVYINTFDYAVNGGPLQNGVSAKKSKARVPPAASDSLGFGQKHDATVDIPLDTMNVMNC